MNHRLLLSTAWLALGLSNPAQAAYFDDVPYPFYITDFSHQHLADNQTEFSITFSSPPQLLEFDFAQRPKGSFQYYILPYEQEPLPEWASYAYIFRAPESSEQGNTLRVRKGYTIGEGEPGSGGWGEVTEVTPLAIQGNTITFTLHDASFGYAPGRELRYEIGSYVYGSTASVATNVPEPQALALMMIGLVGACAMARARQRVSV